MARHPTGAFASSFDTHMERGAIRKVGRSEDVKSRVDYYNFGAKVRGEVGDLSDILHR